jgi:hypothetical protein
MNNRSAFFAEKKLGGESCKNYELWISFLRIEGVRGRDPVKTKNRRAAAMYRWS